MGKGFEDTMTMEIKTVVYDTLKYSLKIKSINNELIYSGVGQVEYLEYGKAKKKMDGRDWGIRKNPVLGKETVLREGRDKKTCIPQQIN